MGECTRTHTQTSTSDDAPFQTDPRLVLLWLRLASRARSERELVKMTEGFSSNLRERFMRFCEVWTASSLERVGLTEDERMVIHLRFNCDYSREEVAGIMGYSESTIKRREYSAAEKIGRYCELP